MPAIGKVKASRVNNQSANTFVGQSGTMFYDASNGLLRFSDGSTPGGIPVAVALPPGTITFGNLIVNDTTIKAFQPNANVIVASNGTGLVELVGNIHIHTSSTYQGDGDPIFSILGGGPNDAFVSIFANSVPAGSSGALNIVGSSNRLFQPITNAGGMLHITGNDNISSRITSDSFGAGASPTYVGRMARGNVSVPTAAQTNDVLTRITGVGWSGTQYGNSNASPTATLRIDGVAGENFTGNTLGSYWKIYTNPIGSVSTVLSANIGSNVTAFPGNITAGNISLTGSMAGYITNSIRDAGVIADGGTITLDFSSDSIVKCIWANGMTVSYANFIPGRLVRLIATKATGSGTDALNLDGISANQTSTGSTTISGSADVSYIMVFYSTTSAIDGLYVDI